MTKTYPMADDEKTRFKLAAFLSVLLVITIPLAIWIWTRLGKARVDLDDERLVAHGPMGTFSIALNEIERIGTLYRDVPQVRPQVREQFGKSVMVLLGFRKRGKTKHFVVTLYEDPKAIIETVSQMTGKPVEDLEQGALGLYWPETA